VTFVVLFLLAVVWAVYLASWLRSRSEHRSVNSITSFNKHLSVLERTTPGRYGRPAVASRPSAGSLPPGYGPVVRRGGMTLQEARKRRRDVLFSLGGAALVTLALAFAAGGVFVAVHVVADALLVGYVAILARVQRLALERRSKVRYLATPVSAPNESPYLLPQPVSAN
jgi:hypothetical protein